MKVAELTCAELDYWVAKAEGMPLVSELSEIGMAAAGMAPPCIFLKDGVYGIASADKSGKWEPSTNWSQGGPVIEREGVDLEHHKESVLGKEETWWEAYYRADVCQCFTADTPLIAAMRAYVASKFGDEVED
jgi:hypothetical protein